MTSLFLTEQSTLALQILNQAYVNELTSDSPRVELTHRNLKVPLRPHQAAATQAMLDHEIRLSKGWDISGQTLYSSWGILGDGVGVGSSGSYRGFVIGLRDVIPMYLIRPSPQRT